MSTTASNPRFMPRFGYLFIGGLVAGTLDLVWVCSLWASLGVGPGRILQAIAAGWLGRDAAVAGGYATAMLGLLSHFGITVTMAWVYYLASTRWAALVRNPYRYGALYGLLLFVVMVYVVVPLSAAESGQSAPWPWVMPANIAAHMLLVGIPCALAARRAAQVGLGDR